jgi:hypothetical protein
LLAVFRRYGWLCHPHRASIVSPAMINRSLTESHDRLDASAISDLQQRNPFLIPAIGDWYFTQGHEYPGLCRYLELLDYLRLSLLSAAEQARFQVS